jgi:hypothetical protein
VKRRLLNLLTALSLAISVALAALWCRSYVVLDGVQVTFRADMLSVYSSAGTIALVWDTGLPPMPRTGHRVTEEDPEPVGGSYWSALFMFDFGRLVWGGSRVVQVPALDGDPRRGTAILPAVHQLSSAASRCGWFPHHRQAMSGDVGVWTKKSACTPAYARPVPATSLSSMAFPFM